MSIELEKDDRKISQEHFIGKCESVFEGIMIIGKRARQINSKFRDEFDGIRQRIVEDKKDNETKRDYFLEAEEELPKYPKPERVALQELLGDELEYKYEDITKFSK